MGKEQFFWLAVLIVSVILEAVTMQLVSAWFIIGAVAALICSFFLPFPFQVAVFAIVSALLFAFCRPLLKKLIHSVIPTNADRDIGKKALVIEDVSEKTGKGRVKLDGIDWNARSVDGSFIETGAAVEVKEISGTTLVVEKCLLLDEKNEEAEIWKKY